VATAELPQAGEGCKEDWGHQSSGPGSRKLWIGETMRRRRRH
jgi:hypothetical protein